MKKPVIHRFNPKKDYSLNNCKFIEDFAHKSINRPDGIPIKRCKKCKSIQIYTRLDGAEVCRKCGNVSKEKK